MADDRAERLRAEALKDRGYIYPEWELEQVRKAVAAGLSAAGDVEEPALSSNRPAQGNAVPSENSNLRIKDMESEIETLKESVNDLQSRLSRLERELGIS